MKRIIEFWNSVFREEAGLTFGIALLSSAPATWFYFSSHVLYYAVIHLMLGYFIATLITMFCCLFRKNVRKWLEFSFLVLGIVNVCVDKFVYNVTHTCFSADTVAIILGSNVSESNEFLSMYVTDKILLFSFGVTIIAALLYIFRRALSKLPYLAVLTSILFIGSTFSLSNTQLAKSVFVLKSILFAQYEKPKDLSLFSQAPDVIVDTDNPKNVVVIIGESFSASHSSLYGYDKDTNPYLKKLADQGNLSVINNVSSAALTTIPSFKMMMSTFSSVNNEKEWYTYLTLFDVIHQGGYKIKWISNQSATGVYDNIVTSFASLSDTTIWCGEKNLGLKKKDLDEGIIPIVKDRIVKESDNQLWFIHMMGSHEHFYERYPDTFDVFKTDDYLEYKENQRIIRAQYDNSILYNDKVVYDIISSFNDTESIIIYFSDHGLDMFDSDPEYFGHARTTEAVSANAARHVPFLVYGTDTYIEKFPEDWNRIKTAASVSKPYNLENLMFTIMDLCNISLADSTEMGPSIFDQD